MTPNRLQSLRVTAQVCKDTANIRRIEGNVDHRIRPIELPFEFLRTRRLADHHRARSGALVEPRGNFIATRREFGIVDMAAVRDEVTTMFEYRRQHDAMFVRVVDAECALLQVEATRSHRIKIIEAPPALGVLQQRLMSDQGAPANVADIDRTRLIDAAQA